MTRCALGGAAGWSSISEVLGAAPTPAPVPPRRQIKPVHVGDVLGKRELLRARAADVEVNLAIDCSGSEYCSSGDPEGMRFAAGRSLVDLMRRTGGGRMSLIHWGSRPVLTLERADVLRQHRTLHRALLDDPGSMGGNDFPAALRMAAALPTAGPAAVRLVIGVTDGLEPITGEMASAVGALPEGSVHVLLVPGHACDEGLASQWQSLPLGSFVRLPADNRAMAHAVGAVYAAAVGGRLPALRTSPSRTHSLWRNR